MKTIFRGRRSLRDEETGEIIETEVVERAVAVGDSGFHKIWLGHILELVEEVGNAKMQVLVWLLKNADGQNQIAASLREIANSNGVGVATVQRLMAALVSANVVTRAGRYGVWRLNPDVVFSGTHQKRMNVLVRYGQEKQIGTRSLASCDSAAASSSQTEPLSQSAGAQAISIDAVQRHDNTTGAAA